MITAAAIRSGWARSLPPATIALAAVGVGSAGALAAYAGQPLLVPALMVLGAAAAVTVSRVEVGIAVAFLLAPLNAGLAGSRAWMPAAVWIAFLLAVSLSGRTEGDELRLPPLGPLVLGFLAVTLLSVTQAAHPGAATSFLRTTATGIALFFVIARTVRTRRQASWVFGGAVAGGALIGLYATSLYLRGAPSSVGFITASGRLIPRVTAGFGQPNQLAGFLALVVPLAIAGVVFSRRGRLAYGLAAATALIGVYASFSRGALVALAVVPLIFLGRGRSWLFVPLLGLALVAGTPSLVRERFAAGGGGGAEVAGRADFWRAAVHIWGDHPVLGVGPGEFGETYAGTRVPGGKNFLQATSFEPPPHAHNLELNLLAEQGLVGLVAFAACFVAGVRLALRLRRSADRWAAMAGSGLLGALAVLAVHNQVDVTVVEATGVYFWAILGLLSALTTMNAAGAAQGRSAAPAPVFGPGAV